MTIPHTWNQSINICSVYLSSTSSTIWPLNGYPKKRQKLEFYPHILILSSLCVFEAAERRPWLEFSQKATHLYFLNITPPPILTHWGHHIHTS